MVQLSIECVESSNECWSAVGRTLPADRLLLAQITRGPKKRDRGLKLKVTWTSTSSLGQPLSVGERQFKNEDEALRNLRGVVGEALGEPPAEKSSTVAKTGGQR